MRCRFCGQPADSKIRFHSVTPRGEFSPECMDPYFSHGCWSVSTCGSPGCEAEAYAEFVRYHPVPGTEIKVIAESEEDQAFMEDDG